MSVLRMYLNCVPPTATAQQKGQRIVTPLGEKPFISHYKKQALKDAETLFCLLLNPYKLKEPITGPVIVESQWVFPWRKSERLKVRKRYKLIPKDTKPDVDNSNKLLLDCLTDMGFWGDDSQVYDLRISKWWGDKLGIYLSITSGDSLPAFPENP